jgi:cytochrome c-type biogenesis protein CcmH
LTFWLAATAIPVVTALLLFRPLLRKGAGPLLGLGLALVVLLPVTALLLYQGVGTPSATSLPSTPPAALAGAGPASEQEINELIAQLQARMEAEPGDLEGWLLLGRSYRSMQRFDDSLAAFRRARELAPRDPVVAVELAEALLFTSQPGQPDPAVPGLLDEALSVEPDLQKGLWLAGMVAAQSGDDNRAVALWERLMLQLEPGSGVANSVQQQLTAARNRLGVPAPDAWAGLEVVVEAPDDLPALSPAAALFIIARDPSAPNPPLGAMRLEPAFPARVRLTDANSMMPQRPISGAVELELQARLSLDGNPLAEDGSPESPPVRVQRDREQPVSLRLLTVD